MQNILKILIYRKEMALACYLTVYYKVALDQEMVRNAIDPVRSHLHGPGSHAWLWGAVLSKGMSRRRRRPPAMLLT